MRHRQLPSDPPLDWRAELVRQDRTVLWLARRSGIHYQAMYRIHRGEQAATADQLAAIVQVLGRP